MKIRLEKNSGFTIIEVIVVLILLGVLTAVVASQTMDNTSELIAQTEVIKSHLRYAQNRAIRSTVKWGIVFAGSTYSLCDQDGNQGFFPGESEVDVALSGMTASGTVFFDDCGVPYESASSSPAISDITITITDGVGNVVITKNTGFVRDE